MCARARACPRAARQLCGWRHLAPRPEPAPGHLRPAPTHWLGHEGPLVMSCGGCGGCMACCAVPARCAQLVSAAVCCVSATAQRARAPCLAHGARLLPEWSALELECAEEASRQKEASLQGRDSEVRYTRVDVPHPPYMGPSLADSTRWHTTRMRYTLLGFLMAKRLQSRQQMN